MDTGCLDARVVGSGGCVSASSVLHSFPVIASCSSVQENVSAQISLHSFPVIASCSLVCSVNSNAYVEIDKHTLWLNPTDVFNISSNTNWIII